ncbi:MAG TPA: hypothetical protein VKI65_16065 [Gemmataceae bacterium]|nr:hypothetical protein [Gemmataceae bacterium]
MDQNKTFDDLQSTLAAKGPAVAIDRLCTTLREQKDYGNLFYALLLKKRHELGVSPVPTGRSDDLPQSVHADYEEAIRQAGRLVGRLYLDEGNIPQAWAYFRMLGEPEPVAQALDKYQAGENDDCQAIVEIAYHHGVNPRKGFDVILERFGICSAITTMGGHLGGPQTEQPPEVREYCIKRLVRALHDQLLERLQAEIERREGQVPATKSIRQLLAGRDWLFEDGFYHIDVSHLGSVVQMSMHLPPCEELELARDLCAYGERLSPQFQYAGDPPFENQYKDYGVYLATLAGDHVEDGIAYFRAKAENADPETIGTFPAEVLVNLLLRINRPAEALDVARKHLAKVEDRQLTCPAIPEICQRVKDYRTLAEVARERGDPVNFMAGLIAAGSAC